MPCVENEVLQVVDVATRGASAICCELPPHDALLVVANLVIDLLPIVVVVVGVAELVVAGVVGVVIVVIWMLIVVVGVVLAHPITKPQSEGQHGLRLDVVVREGVVILQLLVVEAQALVDLGDVLLVADDCLDHVDGRVADADDCDDLALGGLHEDLHLVLVLHELLLVPLQDLVNNNNNNNNMNSYGNIYKH